MTFPIGPYDLILADPPWRFRTWTETNQKKSAKNHYPLLRTSDLQHIPVGASVSKDAVLVLWATQAQLPDAIGLLSHWGFAYKTAGAWAKRSTTGRKWAFGTGYIFRCAAEFFIVGTRGSPKTAAKNVRNLIVAPNREHSRKPDEMYENLEQLWPNARKLELFARSRRPGWDAWGNEIEKFST